MNKTVCMLAIGAVTAFYGNPTGMQLVLGQAESQIMSSEVLQVLTTDRSIIQWDTFSIGENETMKFILPDATAAVLNRVVGSQMSELMGMLDANGQVYLVNPSGIIIGRDARIEAAHFIASTFDVLNEEFITRADMLFKGDSNASIVNLGTISTLQGDCVLLARHVENKGTIDAKDGVAALASATEILLKPDGAKRVFIQAGKQKGALAMIHNSGQIKALLVEMQAEGNPYATAICHNGRIDAQGMKEEHGRVYLVASGGKIDVGGDIRATGAKVTSEHAETENFGEIRVLGQEIYVRDQAMFDVSNPQGGGLISLGFEIEEGGERAKCLVTSEGTLMKADAMESGDGGKVLMWGTDVHYFGTYVSAQGGQLGGDGGIVDASAAGMLKANGLADTLAPNGVPGKLVYDPTDFVISAISGANYEVVYDPIANTYGFKDIVPTKTATMNTATLQNNLTLGNVVITTASAVGGDAGGTISILSPISWTGASTLSLFANQDIIIDANVKAGGNAGISFTSFRDLMIRGNISTDSGMVALASHRNLAIGDVKISTDSGVIALSNTNYYDGTSSINLEGLASITSGLISIDPTGIFKMLPIARAGGSFSSTVPKGHAYFISGSGSGVSAGIDWAASATGGVALHVVAGHPSLLSGNREEGAALIRTHRGDLSVQTAAGPILLRGSSGFLSSPISTSVVPAVLTIHPEGDLSLIGGSRGESFAEISANGGALSVPLDGNLNLTAQNNGWAMIGNGNPRGSDFAKSALIQISIGGEISLNGQISGNLMDRWGFAEIGYADSFVGSFIVSAGDAIVLEGGNFGDGLVGHGQDTLVSEGAVFLQETYFQDMGSLLAANSTLGRFMARQGAVPMKKRTLEK